MLNSLAAVNGSFCMLAIPVCCHHVSSQLSLLLSCGCAAADQVLTTSLPQKLRCWPIHYSLAMNTLLKLTLNLCEHVSLVYLPLHFLWMLCLIWQGAWQQSTHSETINNLMLASLLACGAHKFIPWLFPIFPFFLLNLWLCHVLAFPSPYYTQTLL